MYYYALVQEKIPSKKVVCFGGRHVIFSICDVLEVLVYVTVPAGLM